jgi:hypothetical protein
VKAGTAGTEKHPSEKLSCHQEAPAS